jgi:hypothetical protein
VAQDTRWLMRQGQTWYAVVEVPAALGGPRGGLRDPNWGNCRTLRFNRRDPNVMTESVQWPYAVSEHTDGLAQLTELHGCGSQ